MRRSQGKTSKSILVKILSRADRPAEIDLADPELGDPKQTNLGGLTASGPFTREALESLASTSPLLTGPPIAGLVSFTFEGNAPVLSPTKSVQALGDQQIWIRDLADPSCLRACTHLCTTTGDIETLIQGLRAISR